MAKIVILIRVIHGVIALFNQMPILKRIRLFVIRKKERLWYTFMSVLFVQGTVTFIK